MLRSLDDLYSVKRLANSDRLILATVRPNEQATSFRPENPLAEQLLKRAMGYVDICARKNAEAVASNPMILYRKRRRGRAVTGKQAAYLAGKSGLPRTKFNAQIAQDDDQFEIVDEHPAIELLNRPSPYIRSQSDFRFVQQYAKELTGNSYAAWVAGEKSFYPLHPGFVRVIPDESGGRLIGSYIYGRDTASTMVLETDEILHGTLYTDFRQPYYGISWLNAIIESADLWMATEKYLRETMQSSGRPDILIHFEGNQTEEETEQVRRTFRQRMYEAFRNGMQTVVTGGTSRPVVSQLGHPPKDMASIEIANDAERTIGNAAGIPETIYRMSDANLTSSNAAERTWKRDTIMPRCVREAEEMTEWLHAAFTGSEDMFFAPENCVPADREAEAREATTAWSSGLITRNEARAVLGYDPMRSAEGEALSTPQEQQPGPFAGLFAPSKPEPQASVMPEQDAENLAEGEKLNGAQITGALAILERVTLGTLAAGAATELLVALGIDRDRARAMVEENKRDAKPVEEAGEPIKSRKVHDPGDESDHDKPKCCDHESKQWLASKAWKDALKPENDLGLQVEQGPAERLMAAYDQFFQSMRDSIIQMTEQAPMGLKGATPRRYRKKADISTLLRTWGITDFDRWSDELTAQTEAIIQEEYFVQAGDAIASIREAAPDSLRDRIPEGDARNIIIQNDRAALEAAKFSERYARDMDEVIRTLAEDLADNISEGLEKGESLRQIQDRILNLYNAESESGLGTMSQRRAATIARTEVARASTDARIAGMYGSEVVRGYKFIKAASACPICDAVEASVASRTFDLSEPIFPKGATIQATDGRTYSFDYDDTIVPIHPNCRCGVEAVLID